MPKLKPNHISPTDAEEATINAQIAADPDDRELDDEWFSNAKSASEFFPPEVYAELVELQHRGSRPQNGHAKSIDNIAC